MTPRSTPELLAPVGEPAMYEAAVRAGADSVYLGVSAMNARSDRAQLTLDDLSEIVRDARLRDLRVYLALNILLKDDELPAAERLAAEAARLGVDGIIVQDRGLMAALHASLPDMPLHASTQCSLMLPEALEALVGLGVTRVVIPRELRLPEIRRYVAEASAWGMETEAFVQGAMCIAVSGQCLLSWAEGDRSANRGRCAQPCRLRYRLTEDGRTVAEPAKRLSPRDMSRLRDLPELAAAGVGSLKIEGRLRSPDYVAETVGVYRRALDRMERSGDPDAAERSEADAELRRGDVRLRMAFSRGPGFNRGYDDGRGAAFLSGDRSGHYGLRAGTVTRRFPDTGELMIRGDEPLPLPAVPGMVWSLRDCRGREHASAPIHHLKRRTDTRGPAWILRGFHPRVIRRLPDEPLEAFIMAYPPETPTDAPEDKSATLADTGAWAQVDMNLRAGTSPLDYVLAMRVMPFAADLTAFTETVTATTPADYRAELSEARIVKQLGKLGGTPFIPGTITAVPVKAPVSWINRLRREAAEQAEARLRALAASGMANDGEETARADGEEPEAVCPATPRSAGSEEVRHPLPPDREAYLEKGRRQIHEHIRRRPPVTASREATPRRLVDHPAWDGEPLNCEALAALRPGEPLPQDLVLPLDRLCRYGIPDHPASVAILGDWPLNLSQAGHRRLWRDVPALFDKGLSGVVTAVDLGIPIFARWGERLPATFRLIAGPGSHAANQRTLMAYAAHGYTDVYLDDLITRGEDDEAVRTMAKTFPSLRLWVPGPGPSRAMTLRFCPVGYSHPTCRRCLHHRYALEQPNGTMLPLIPLRDRECSAYVMTADGHGPGERVSGALSDFPRWEGAIFR